MTSNRTIYNILGVFLLLSALMVNIPSVIHGSFPPSLMLISIGIMALCLGYLAPHFAAKDERVQKFVNVLFT